MDIARFDDETHIIDPNILDVVANLPPKKPVDWTSCWVSSHSIYRCSQRESLSEQYGDVTLVQWQRNIFILDIRFLSISLHVVVLYVVSLMYLYLFSRINYSCMASPFIQLSKNTYFYFVICYYHAVIRNYSCQGTNKLNPWKMAVPGAHFGGKRMGSNGLNARVCLITSESSVTPLFIQQPYARDSAYAIVYGCFSRIKRC